ncbi:MAG TPA: TA system VapC family ribonuclease toxin [Candidatus Margulisiibacteriota bacterium]|nr:TA system VapC family ribonuclease toxin [Candidatus Margulisiibacteriota bacterium]
MLMPDVNVLVYAHRADETVHQAYKRWLTDLVNDRQPFALSVLVAVGFVRIVTNARIYPRATPLSTALAVIDQMVTHPRCRVVNPSGQHWQQVADLCRRTKAAGKLVADAQHAAIAIAEGCTWVTRDADFASFAPHGLRWEHLLLS